MNRSNLAIYLPNSINRGQNYCLLTKVLYFLMDIQKYKGTFGLIKVIDFWSDALNRHVVLDILLPPSYNSSSRLYPLLLMNDGQDIEAVKLLYHLQHLTDTHHIDPPVTVCVYAGNRKQEYGVASLADYKNRGNLAADYSKFVMSELMPYLFKKYRIDQVHPKNTLTGFSLGGLSAFDIAWHYSDVFKQVGVFSGAFWWRYKPVDVDDPDNHRIMHEVVRNTLHKPTLKFWFQSGLLDEAEDRNNNGVIDVIDDILDLCVELVYKGFRPFHDFTYLEMPDGLHDTKTWAKAMPKFLVWAFGGNITET